MFCNPNVISSTEEQFSVRRPARVVADQISDSARDARQYGKNANLFLNVVDADGAEKFRPVRRDSTKIRECGSRIDDRHLSAGYRNLREAGSLPKFLDEVDAVPVGHQGSLVRAVVGELSGCDNPRLRQGPVPPEGAEQ